MKTIGSIISALLLATITIAQQPPAPPQGGPPSPEMRLKQVSSHLEKDLALKPDQKQKVEQAYKTFFDAMEKMRGKDQPPPPPPGKRADVEKLAGARDESIKKALTADQFKKYQEIEKTMRPGPRGPDGPRGERQAPPPPR